MSWWNMFSGSTSSPQGPQQKPLDPQWSRSPKGKYFYLLDADTYDEQTRTLGGVFVIWNGGTKPQWLYVGQSTDIFAASSKLRANKDLREFEKNGRLFITWSPVKDVVRAGIVAYLVDVMQPKFGCTRPNAKPIPVYIPG